MADRTTDVRTNVAAAAVVITTVLIGLLMGGSPGELSEELVT